ILDEHGARFESALPYLGLGNEATAKALIDKYGDDYVVVSIGQAGEMQLGAAAIAVTDANGQPFRMAARGGMGAVMGSKGLKAILIRRIAARDGALARDAARSATIAFHKFVAPSPRVKVLREYGTASTVMLTQMLGGLPTRNFSAGQFEHAEAIGGEALRDIILSRGGEGAPTEACMDGCLIQCSNIFADAEGRLSAAPLEFETIGLVGANLGLESLDEVARINRLCNDLGLDTIEIGAALGVMMEAAETDTAPVELRELLPRFGDGAPAAEIVAEIARGTRLGKLLASGVVAVGKALGVRRVPAVKGQAMSAYDPRAIKGTGVTYATSPQGADHTAGLTVFAQVDHRDPTKAVALSRASQLQRAAYDALGLCVFNIGATGARPDLVLAMLKSTYGLDLPPDWLDSLGRRVIDLERAFNRAAGFTDSDDRLPDFLTHETLPPTGSVFDVPEVELDQLWNNSGVADSR
ncbi:MAG: aldehyde ferredoxin oxidoreductase, partial [Chloroflexi bacterium]|nr:aldehyde ferredoxin oxidoreductase [Chloroflexota bacterium]